MQKIFLLKTHYDYIITGAGCSGLSLLMQMIMHKEFEQKTILLIDSVEKNTNDHTWCFWEKETGYFESVVHHSWTEFSIYGNEYEYSALLHPYKYKMIRSKDFYHFIFTQIKQYHNIEFAVKKVESIETQNNKVVVKLFDKTITADWCFNSILFEKPVIAPNQFYLLQHFKGYWIETNHAVFNPAKANFMDFRTSQKHGTSFMYVLPISSSKALVEYTIFSKQILQQENYDIALKEYLKEILNLSEYTIHEEEFGVIPMTNYAFPMQEDRLVNIGIAGGKIKASSGFAFQFIQKQSREIVDSLLKYNTVHLKKNTFNKYKLYDSILLHVLSHKKMSGQLIFSDLFLKNDIKRVLRFLDNESSLSDELKIMMTMPANVFLTAAIKEIKTLLFKK